jgi:hypothetical protein
MPVINPGDLFRPHGHPARRLAGEPPEARSGNYRVVLSIAARGAPTAAPLRVFQHAEARLARGWHPGCGASLDETSTRRFISRHRSTFPVGPSADGPHVRELTGAFVDPDPESIQERPPQD